MAFFQYLVFDGENLPLPDSYEVELEDVEADSGGETEAGTTQRDVVRHGVVSIPVSFSVTAKWLKKLAGYAKLDKISVRYFDVETAELKLAEKIFGAVGIVMLVDEHNLDAVTALSGSGPAYVFEFIQALADGGVASGLPRAAATELAVQTVIGAAEMVRATGLHPTALKDQVTSPGGTTIRALEVLEDRAFAGTVIQAVRAACARSEELGRS